MHKNQTIATPKIILFVAFISAALFSSLFIFHFKQQAKENFSSNDALLFPVAREIKPFELITGENNKFTQKNLLNHTTLFFFGFTHCSNICPIALSMLNVVYQQLQNEYPHLQVVFISLDPERDTPKTANDYAHSFNPKFIGTSSSVQELRKLQSQLGIYSAQDGSNDKNYQILHTPSIILIDHKGRWAGTLKYAKADIFANTLQNMLKQLP